MKPVNAEDFVQAYNTIDNEVYEERKRQNAKWGQQNHPSVISECSMQLRKECEANQKAERWHAEQRGHLTWEHIAHEEFLEALASDNDTERRAELIQLAAVCFAWIENIDRDMGKNA